VTDAFVTALSFTFLFPVQNVKKQEASVVIGVDPVSNPGSQYCLVEL